jgi:hypothetical protein
MSLEWTRIHEDAIGSHSKCRRYSVCPSNDTKSLWEVWKLAPGGPWFALLAKNLPTETAARDVAQNDWDLQGKRA